MKMGRKKKVLKTLEELEQEYFENLHQRAKVFGIELKKSPTIEGRYYLTGYGGYMGKGMKAYDDLIKVEKYIERLESTPNYHPHGMNNRHFEFQQEKKAKEDARKQLSDQIKGSVSITVELTPEELENEIWLPIPIAGYRDCQVSNMGRVKNHKGKFVNIRAYLTNHGEPQVSLKNKTFFVKKLVALAFIPNPKNRKWVFRKNSTTKTIGNVQSGFFNVTSNTSCKASDLEWIAHKEEIPTFHEVLEQKLGRKLPPISEESIQKVLAQLEALKAEKHSKKA